MCEFNLGDEVIDLASGIVGKIVAIKGKDEFGNTQILIRYRDENGKPAYLNLLDYEIEKI